MPHAPCPMHLAPCTLHLAPLTPNSNIPPARTPKLTPHSLFDDGYARIEANHHFWQVEPSMPTDHASASSPSSSSRAWQIALVGVLLAAFALRLYQLGVQSLWYDETVSAWFAIQSIPELLARTARDIHPPLYYLLLHGWQGFIGRSEWSLAIFSVGWGVLLIASSYKMGEWLAGRPTGLLAAALVAMSPFNVWYSQEVRMYTMGATLGLWSLMALWQLLQPGRMKKRWMALWVMSAVAGLYTLYYLGFLLLAEALIVLATLWRHPARTARLRRWFWMAGATLFLWLPWLPTALRQAFDPPVPPWRVAVAPRTMILESLGALAFGQSMDFEAFGWSLWALLAVIAVGLWVAWPRRRPAVLLLLAALVLPLLILWGSAFSPSPLYHARYLFTFSPAFYLLMALAFIALARQARRHSGMIAASISAALLLAPLLLFSAQSLQRFWHDPAYTTDDLRRGAALIEEQWRSHDVVLSNAGYTYPALTTYLVDPIAVRQRLSTWQGAAAQSTPSAAGVTIAEGGIVDGDATLGWGLAESDFYASSREATTQSLDGIWQIASRLWQLRLYDTVSDPEAVIREWLERHGHLFFDEPLSGDSNARVQGWYFPPRSNERPDQLSNAQFLAPEGDAPWVALRGISVPRGPLQGGGWLDMDLWLEALPGMDITTRMSVGLFDTTLPARQWTVLDEQPLGPLLSLPQLPGVQRWPVRLRLPIGLPPGSYEVHVKFYRPSDGAFLQPVGDNVVLPDRVRLGFAAEIGPTPTDAGDPRVGTPQEAQFGPLTFLGHAIPAGPWQPGETIPIELVWRVAERPDDSLQLFLTSNAITADSGGVTTDYPMSRWQAGEVIRDVHYVTLAPNVEPGDYPLFVSVSQAAANVPWSQGLFRSGELLQIGLLTVEDRARNFEPPALQYPLDVQFGETIQLIGADYPAPDERHAAGEALSLALYWHALAPPPERYKIFMHLIDPDGNLVDQCDIEPEDGRHPTNGWREGEYISTGCDLPVPEGLEAGDYEVRIGLYNPITGDRLPPSGPNSNDDERYLLLATYRVAP